MLFGFLYGELFGFEVHALTLWTNPLHGEVTHVLIAAIGYGVIVISLGLVLNMVNRFRRGDVVGGIMDKFGAAGAVLYWGALAIGINAWVRGAEIGAVWYVLLIGVPLLAMFLKEPIQHVLASRAGRKTHASNVFEAIFESGVEVFEALLGYMANTISFVRLAAYAMSHAAILYAALMMANQMREMAGAGLGGVLYVAIMIVGNVLTILLEGIIASVQALRLQYYEFFGKFFSGTGRAFEPFRLRGEGGK
jgi:V/A-type H+-transporting ATPase subunit I